MPAHIVYGDSFLTSRRILQIRQKDGLASLSGAAEQRMKAQESDAGQVISTCRAMPFLEPGRFIVIEGVLTTRERSSSAAERKNSTGWERLATEIPEMPETTTLVLLDEKVSKSNALFKRLQPVCQVHEETPPAGSALRRWIANSAVEKQTTISEDATRLLEEAIGADLWALDRELERLSLYRNGEPIRARDVTNLVNTAREANIFAVVDAAVEGRTGEALQGVHRLTEDGTEPMNIMTIINRQLRLMALAQDLNRLGRPIDQWSRGMGFGNRMVAQKAARQVSRMTKAEIRSMYDQTTQADLDIKRGRLEPVVAVETLVTRLSEIHNREHQPWR